MKILVIGAASKPGKKIISSALRRGHIITAFTERQNQVQLYDDNLRIIRGCCRSASDLNGALENQDVVINVIAKEKKSLLPISKKISHKSIDAIQTMMYGHQIKRFIIVDTTANIVKKLDSNAHIKAIKASSLDWTLVRPARLMSKSKTCDYHVGENAPIRFFSKISYGSVADYVVNNIENDSIIGRVIVVRH